MTHTARAYIAAFVAAQLAKMAEERKVK